MTFGTTVASTRTGRKGTTVSRTSERNSVSTPMCSLWHSRPAGHVYGCTKHWNSWVNRSSITTLILYTTCILLINLISPSALISVSSPTNLNPVSTLRNFVGAGLKTMGTDPMSIRQLSYEVLRQKTLHELQRPAFAKHVKSSPNPNSFFLVVRTAPNPPISTIN